MAVLYVTEYSTMGRDPNGVASMAQEPPMAEQTVAIGGGSLQSVAFQPATRFVRLHTDSVCSIEFGPNPTATTTTARMAANQTEYYAVPQGSAFKVAVISNS
jgi:hypothetical protein